METRFSDKYDSRFSNVISLFIIDSYVDSRISPSRAGWLCLCFSVLPLCIAFICVTECKHVNVTVTV